MNFARFTQRRKLRLFVTAGAAAIAAVLIPASQIASAHTTTPVTATQGSKPTIVLEHEAWADSGSWNAVVRNLQRDGYTVYAPPNPLQGLTYDSAYLRDFLHSILGRLGDMFRQRIQLRLAFISGLFELSSVVMLPPVMRPKGQWTRPARVQAHFKMLTVIHAYKRMTDIILLVKHPAAGGPIVGTSQSAKATSHDRILDIAAARIRRDGIDSLAVADIMKEAGLTHGGFYRHFDSREHLIAEATQLALTQGSSWTMASAQRGGPRAFAKLVDGYLSTYHRDHPESGCGVAGVTPDVARASGSARASYTRQVQECLAVLAELIDDPDRQAGEGEAVLALSALVGAISMARAVDDPELSRHILAGAAAALKQAISQ